MKPNNLFSIKNRKECLVKKGNRMYITDVTGITEVHMTWPTLEGFARVAPVEMENDTTT